MQRLLSVTILFLTLSGLMILLNSCGQPDQTAEERRCRGELHASVPKLGEKTAYIDYEGETSFSFQGEGYYCEAVFPFETDSKGEVTLKGTFRKYEFYLN